jgi:CheY-specific phosphatase CheX
MSTNEVTEAFFCKMQEHLATSTRELFAGYGIFVGDIPYEPDRPSQVDSQVASTIGFAGEKLRGAIVMTTSSNTVRDWQSTIQETTAGVCDALGEFSNMLLGRLKGHLRGEGVTILISTPTTASGRELVLASAQGRASTWLRFEGSGWRLDVRLDVSFDSGFEVEASDGSQLAADAGEMLLF